MGLIDWGMRGKKGIALEIIAYWILALVVLIIILQVTGFLAEWWEGAIEAIKNIGIGR